MESVKKFLGAALIVTAGFAMYDLIVKPVVAKVKTSVPATA